MSTARDLLLTNGDITIVNGDLALVYDGAAIVQDVQTALLFFLGEWFADVTVGMDYWGTFLVKNPDAAAIRAAVRKTILARKGIQAVTSIDLTVDSVARVLTVRWAAISDVGALSAVAVIGS